MDVYLAAEFRQVLRKLPIRSLKSAYRNLTERKITGIKILDKHSRDDSLRAVDEILRERGKVPPGELKHVPMTDDGCKAIAYELLENPQFWFNTDRMKKLTGLVYWSQVYKVLDVLQDKYFIAQARQRYKEMGASETAKIALKNIEEVSRVMRFTWEDHKAAPMARQKLLTKEIRERLPKLGATEHIKDPIVQVKFFTPWTNWTWYATEFDGDDTFFGWVVGFEKELGYFSLSELESVTGPMGLYIERDMYFEPKPLSEVMAAHGSSLPMTIPKEKRHSIFRVSDGKLMFRGNQVDTLTEFDRLGGRKAGYALWYTASETMPRLDVVNGKLVLYE